MAVALLAGLSGVATIPSASAATTTGYWLLGTDGGVFSFGQSKFFGSTGAIRLNQPIVGMAATPDGKGYWMVASDGGIFAFGNAGFYGSMGGKRLNQPIVGMAATRTGKGYWLVASDGGIFAFGDAGFFGSTGGIKLNKPIVDIVPTPSGKGYWMAASDGGIFAFGDAGFFGSTGALKLTKRIQQMAATPSGKGYWMVAGDGGVFAFGDAGFHGSAVDGKTEKRVVDIAPSASGKGYYMTASNGAVFAFGDAKPYGSMEGQKLAHGIIAMVALNNGEPPVAGEDVLNVDEDGVGTIDVLANDRDADGGPLGIQGVSPSQRGATVTLNGGTITYRPAPDMNGSDSLTYTLVDDRGNTATGQVKVNIRPLNDLPRAADDSVAGNEDVPFGIEVLGNDHVADGFASVTVVRPPLLGTASVTGDRILYTPKPNANGSDTLRYRVIDADGQNAEADVKITLRGTNDLPIAVDVDVPSCTRGTCEASVLTAPGVSFGDTARAQLRLVGEDQNKQVVAEAGIFRRTSRNTIEFEPGRNSLDVASVQFQIGDDNNGAAEIEWSDPKTATFHFRNQAPIAHSGGHQVASGQPTGGQLLGEDPDGDQIMFVVEGTTGPFFVNPDGTFSLEPMPAGEYVITFHVTDGGLTSGQATYTVTVVDPSPPAF